MFLGQRSKVETVVVEEAGYQGMDTGTVSKIQRDPWVEEEIGPLTGTYTRWIELIAMSILCYIRCQGWPGGPIPWWAPREGRWWAHRERGVNAWSETIAGGIIFAKTLVPFPL